MPVYATRKLRNFATGLMLVAGCTHIGQLWLYPLSGTSIIAAMSGVLYLLIALGLAGRSRFSLWMGLVIPAIDAGAGILRYRRLDQEVLTLSNIAINLLLIAICAYILYRTRNARMD